MKINKKRPGLAHFFKKKQIQVIRKILINPLYVISEKIWFYLKVRVSFKTVMT